MTGDLHEELNAGRIVRCECGHESECWPGDRPLPVLVHHDDGTHTFEWAEGAEASR